MDFAINAAGLGVQIIIAVLLCKYARDTLKLRQASQEQNEILQMPCLVLLVQRREDIDIVADGVEGVPYPEEWILEDKWSGTGHISVQNVGYGPAFNVCYEIQKQDPSTGTTERGYLPYILRGEKEPVCQVASNLDPGDEDENAVVRFKLSYESHSGCRHASEINIRRGTRQELVVSKCQFPIAGRS